MQRDHETRLFSPDDLLSNDELTADARGAVAPAQVERDRDLDAARLWISKDDGLLVRGVKPHSARKSTLVSRGVDTVSSAMAGKWFAVKHGVQYLELYSGPGRLLDESTGVEQPGSPLCALSVRKPFSRYVFSDFSQPCVDALSARVGMRADVHTVGGDANDRQHLERVAQLLNSRALVIAYLDPARPQDLSWETVEFLATHFGFIDLIINLPVNSLMRAILGAHRGGGRGPGAAGRFLNHPAPHELLQPSTDRPSTGDDDQRDPPVLRPTADGTRLQAARAAHHRLSGGQSVLRHPAGLAARARPRAVEQDQPDARGSADVSALRR